MNVIYSDSRIEGLKGVYASPSLFNGDTEKCTQVFTDEENIANAYKAKGIKVDTIPRTSKAKKALEAEELISSQKANELYKNLNSINADDVKALAKYMNIEYTTKDETVSAIKEKVSK